MALTGHRATRQQGPGGLRPLAPATPRGVCCGSRLRTLARVWSAALPHLLQSIACSAGCRLTGQENQKPRKSWVTATDRAEPHLSPGPANLGTSAPWPSPQNMLRSVVNLPCRATPKSPLGDSRALRRATASGPLSRPRSPLGASPARAVPSRQPPRRARPRSGGAVARPARPCGRVAHLFWPSPRPPLAVARQVPIRTSAARDRAAAARTSSLDRHQRAHTATPAPASWTIDPGAGIIAL